MIDLEPNQLGKMLWNIARFSALDAQIAAESEKLAALKTHKQGLMQQLFQPPDGGSPAR